MLQKNGPLHNSPLFLQPGQVAVMPTDTLYGLVARALDPQAVERVYEIRKRDADKPCIILISDIGELEKFAIQLSEKQKTSAQKYWQEERPTSLIFRSPGERFSYLHRGTETLAFRLPLDKKLRDLLTETGPLIAPSANPQGLPSAKTINEAKKYFGNLVDLYIDGGTLLGLPSRVIELHDDGSVDLIRE